MYDKQKVIDLALREVGYHETGNNRTKYAEEIDAIRGFYNGAKNGYAWCDVFVDWCFVKCFGVVGAKELLCQPDYSAGAGCLYSAGYFRNKGQFYTSGPQTGDQIFFTYRAGEVSHTGIVVEVNGSTVVTVEGNSADAVQRKTYSITDGRIYGYGRPNWGGAAAADTPEALEPQAKKPYKYHLTQYPVTLTLLRRGDYGPQVVDMQAMLNAKGWPCATDGEFGIDTEKALKAFQRAVGLIDDGEYGGMSMNALINY